MHAGLRRSLAALALAGWATPTLAQRQPDPVGARRVVSGLSADERRVRAHEAVRDGWARAQSVGLHAVAGGAIGVAVGMVVAYHDTHLPHVTDHSEDGFAYAVCGVVGGLAGTVVGGVVGLIRTARVTTVASAGVAATPAASPVTSNVVADSAR